ncbi:hypothetical protein GW17_00054409 [Ensete ventricosum]|nr:hypothetical protein GW17_00054409 [Ensete ventricosum]
MFILLVPSAEERRSWTASLARLLPEEVERPLVCYCLHMEETIRRCGNVLSNRGRGSRLRGNDGGSGCEGLQRTMQWQGRKKGQRSSCRLEGEEPEIRSDSRGQRLVKKAVAEEQQGSRSCGSGWRGGHRWFSDRGGASTVEVAAAAVARRESLSFVSENTSCSIQAALIP